MKPLEDMPLGQRVVTTVVIVLVILLIVSFIGYLTGRWEASAAPQPPCMSAEVRDKVRVLTVQALDQAYVAHVVHVYDVWMRDDTGQPQRAAVGVNKGLRAYVSAQSDLAKWQPPCLL